MSNPAQEAVGRGPGLYSLWAGLLLAADTGIAGYVAYKKGVPTDLLLGRALGPALLMLIVLAISQIWKGARNSRTRAIIATVTLGAIFLTSAQGVALAALRARRAANAPAAPQRITTQYASFCPPTGWIAGRPDRDKTIGIFVRAADDPRNPEALISIEAGKPSASSAEDLAAGLAENWGGQVLPEPTDLDGERAIHVRAAGSGVGLRPVEGIVCFREGRAYLLMGGCKVGGSVSSEVEEVRKS